MSFLGLTPMIYAFIVVSRLLFRSGSINIVNTQLSSPLLVALFCLLIRASWAFAVWCIVVAFLPVLVDTTLTSVATEWMLLQNSWCLRNGWIRTSWATSFFSILFSWSWGSSRSLLGSETLILSLIVLSQVALIDKLIHLRHQVLSILVVDVLPLDSKPLLFVSCLAFCLQFLRDRVLLLAIWLSSRLNCRLHLQRLVTTLFLPLNNLLLSQWRHSLVLVLIIHVFWV